MKPEAFTRAIHEACARAAHEVNRAYCIAIGDVVQPMWDDLPDWQKDSERNGVESVLAENNPEFPHAKLSPARQAQEALFVSTVRETYKALQMSRAAWG
jgi:hypothetical protein